MLTASEAQRILDRADEVCSAAEVAGAVSNIAREVTRELAERQPLVLAVMRGAVVFAGALLPRLAFPLEFDYLHVTRYGADNSGADLRWLVKPDRDTIAGRTVLVLDDILDEGITLAAIKSQLLALGATACYTAVFAEKDLGRKKPIEADFVGVTVPNRYVFGFGMDVSGAWRNLPAVYAVNER